MHAFATLGGILHVSCPGGHRRAKRQRDAEGREAKGVAAQGNGEWFGHKAVIGFAVKTSN
jgi:hypothetical protein